MSYLLLLKPCVSCIRGQLSVLASGVVTSSSLFGALLGSIATFLLKDRIGRRSEMFISASAYGALPTDASLIFGAHLYDASF